MENNNRSKVNDIARDAYTAIEDVVTMLLKIDKGDKVLSKDTAINDKLTTAVNKFEVLSKVSTNNMTVYDLSAGNAMTFENKFSIFERELEGRMDSWNGQIQAIYYQSNRSQNEMNRCQGQDEDLKRQFDEALEDANINVRLRSLTLFSKPQR